MIFPIQLNYKKISKFLSYYLNNEIYPTKIFNLAIFMNLFSYSCLI